MAWWLPDGWRQVDVGAMERLLFFDARVAADGRIDDTHGWPGQWSALIAAAQVAGTPIDVTVTVLDSKTFRSVFGRDESMQRLLTDILALASGEATHGIQLDVEVYDDIDDILWERYQRWVQALAQSLRMLQPARQISVFFPLGGKRPLYAPATAALLDHVVMQGYDAHWKESPQAGPVAPLDGPYAVTWKSGLRLADRLGIGRGKTLMGFPLYGYEWRVSPACCGASKVLGKGISTTFASLAPALQDQFPVSVEQRVASAGATLEPRSASSYYRFRDAGGQWREGWFEDWWSLQQKAQFLQREGLRGVAFFLLGYDAGHLVNSFHQLHGAARPAPSSPLNETKAAQ
ncbi:MAG: glycosyl hydrolase family 18 protein [Rhodoferax sp.]